MKAADVKKSPSGTYVAIFEDGEVLTFYWVKSDGYATHNTAWARKFARKLDEKHRNPMDVFTSEDFDKLSEISVEPEEEVVSNTKEDPDDFPVDDVWNNTDEEVEEELDDTETETAVNQEKDATAPAETILNLSDGPDFPPE